MNLADDSGRRVPCTDPDAIALLPRDVRPHVDTVLVDHATVVFHFDTLVMPLLAGRPSSDESETPLPFTSSPPPAYAFLRDGSCWTIFFAARRTHFHGADGLAHLAEMLRHPDEYVPALALAALLDTVTEGERDPQADRAWDSALSTAQSGLPALDAKTPALYRRRLEALDAAADRARVLGDDRALERCADERRAILKELAAGLDHKGRPRLTHDGAERARQNVQKAVKAAIEKIAAEDPVLGEHLRSSIDTGTQCRYRPVPPIPWMFS